MIFERKTKGRTRTTPASGEQNHLLRPPGIRTLSGTLPLLLQHRSLLLFLRRPPVSSRVAVGSGGRVGEGKWKRKTRKKEGKEEKGESTGEGEYLGILRSQSIFTTNHAQAFNFHSNKRLLSLGQTTQLQGVRNKTTRDTPAPTHQKQQGMIFQK